MDQEEISVRKEKSRLQYVARKVKQQDYNDTMTEGRGYVHENRDCILILEINEDISFALEYMEFPEYPEYHLGRFTFTFRRNPEVASYRVAKAALGAKLQAYVDCVDAPISTDMFQLAKVDGSQAARDFIKNYAINLLVIGIFEGTVNAPLWAETLVTSQFF